MWPERLYFPVFAAIGVIVLWRRFRKSMYGQVADRKSIAATLLKHAQACKRDIHEVPRDDNSLFSALADQLTDATFTGQSLRDHIETFISGRRPSEQQESLMLSNTNTGPTIQDAADFLRHPIVLYRDDDNPPFFFQPNVDGSDLNLQILHIGYINRYYVSFRPHDYNKGQGASVHGNTDSDEDRSDMDSENPWAFFSIGDENKTTIIAPGDAERPINLTVINRGNNNRVALNIIVSENVEEYVERMIASESSVGDVGIHMKIKTLGIGQEEIDRAERNVIKNRIKIQDNINDAIRPLGVILSMLGLGCLLMWFQPKSWLNCRAFIMGLRLHNDKYLDIFRELLTAFQHINDSNNITMDVKISIGQLSEGTDLSDSISGTESKDIFDRQARTIEKRHHSFEKKDIRKKQTTADPRSGPSVEFKEADVPYIPHTKTHDQMSTIQRPVEKRGDRRVVRPEEKDINVRIPEDKKTCSNYGCCHLNDGSLIVADYNNKRLKLVDPSSSKVTKFCDIDEQPTDVCCIGPQEVAVAFDSTKVHMYNTVSLTRTRTVKLGHKTGCIACHGGLLYCAGWPGGTILYVHDVRSGKKLRNISKDIDGRELFSAIRHIAVNSSGDRLYVADCGRGLVCVGTDGRPIFCLSHEDLGLSSAYGVTTDHHGHVFVCGRNSHNVVKVTEDGHVVGQILSEEDGITWCPYCLSYDVSRSSLYVGGYSDQLLMVEWK